jgi:hypothetical protein
MDGGLVLHSFSVSADAPISKTRDVTFSSQLPRFQEPHGFGSLLFSAGGSLGGNMHPMSKSLQSSA